MQGRNNDPRVGARKPIRVQRCRNTASGDLEEIFVPRITPRKNLVLNEVNPRFDVRFFFLSFLSFFFFLDETKRSKIISIPLRLRGGCNNNETSRTIRGGNRACISLSLPLDRVLRPIEISLIEPGIKWKVSMIRLKALCDNPCRVAID